MAVEIALTPATVSNLYKMVDVEVTGLEADTDYMFLVRNPSGNVRTCEIRSDGSGEAMCEIIPVERGTHTAEIRPLAEYHGTTTAADDATIRGG